MQSTVEIVPAPLPTASTRKCGGVSWALVVKKDVKGFITRKHRTRFQSTLITLVCLAAIASPARAQSTPEFDRTSPTIFPKLRALDLPAVRGLALKQSTSIALAGAKTGQARADLRDLQNRFKIGTGGGIGIGSSPFQQNNGGLFSSKVSFYLSLDLERLLQLNKQQRVKAQQAIKAEEIGETDAQNAAIKSATTAWFGLRRTEASVTAASRYRETAQAIYVAADARFKSGQGELSGVLSGLRGTWESEDAYNRARQDVALACLELAQACGYATAEDMEAAL